MRRGGRLFLFIGILVAVLAVLGLLYFLQQGTGQVGQQGGPVLPPTAVPQKRVVTAKIDIPNGTVLTDTGTLEQFLSTEEIPEPEYNQAPDQYFTSPNELLNKVTTRDILALERVTRSAVTDTGLSFQIPPAQEGEARPKAFFFQVDNLTGVADQIKPGDAVDVLASFDVTRTALRPGFPAPGQETTATVVYSEAEFTSQSTKTLLQNVQVLKILKPVLPPSGTPGPEGEAAPAPPATDSSGQPVQGAPTPQAGSPDTFTQDSTWLIGVAVTDQQAEVLKYAIERSNGITLVLRGRGDADAETTLGVTLDILISRYGLPVPEPVAPAVGAPSQLVPPQPTAVPPTQTP